MEQYLVYILPPVFAGVGFTVRFIWDFYINRRKRELQEKIKIVEYRLKEFYYPIFFYLKREQIIWEKILKLHHIATEQSHISIDIPHNAMDTFRSMINSSFPYRRRTFNSREIQLQSNNPIPSPIPSPPSPMPSTPSPINPCPNAAPPPPVNDHFQLIQALDEENLKIHKTVQTIIHEKISIALPPKHLVDLLLQYDEHVTVYQILRTMDIYDKFPTEYDAPYPHNIIKEVEKRIEELNTEYIKYNKKLSL